jgi:adenosylmethionine-8-amino-7-oxononanoate aminotransferase
MQNRTGVNGEHYINHIVTTPDPYFIGATNTKANVVDAEYLANDLSAVIEQLGPSKVVAVVMDNASTCAAAGNLIAQR